MMPVNSGRRGASGRRARRVPVVLQQNAVECGAACLAMILGAYGRKTSVAEACGSSIGRDGMNARTLAESARRLGLDAKVFATKLDALGEVPLPAILHWNFNHFVVLERWSKRGATLIDPAVGRRRVSRDEMDGSFTGVLIVLEPGQGFERRRRLAGISGISYFRSLVSPRQIKRGLAQVVLASLLLQVLGLAVPLLTMIVVDYVLPQRMGSLLGALGAGILAWLAAQFVTGYLRAALLIELQGRIDVAMMSRFFRHLLSLPLRFFQQRSSGDILMRLASNLVIREAVTAQTLSMLLDGGLVLLYLAILLAADLPFGAAALAIGLLQICLLAGSARPLHALTQRQLAAQAESQGYAVEMLRAIATVKVASREERALGRWTNLYHQQLNLSLTRSRLSALVQTVSAALQTTAPLLLLWLGASRVLSDDLSLGTMLGLTALAGSWLTPLGSLVNASQRLQLVGAHLERVRDVLEAKPEQPGPLPAAPRLTGRIEVRDLAFRYGEGSPLVLEEISFAVEPGQKVAIVGATGSGKSTLLLMLLGAYPAESGEILFDGVSLENLDLASLRRQLGVVLQDLSLFSGSIRQNIAFHEPDAPLEQVALAARFARIHPEIQQMPLGYETLVGEGGSALSGGQRQRLCIARAVFHRPSILLLDEATSQLDIETERHLEQSFARLPVTRILCSHRLSAVRDADFILVLHDGRVVERGTHEELVALAGRYVTLFGPQLSESRSQIDAGASTFVSKESEGSPASSSQIAERPGANTGVRG